MNNSSRSDRGSSSAGEIRIRSNVCTDPNAVHCVPGTLMQSYFPQHPLTRLQREELAYLWPCTVCKRRLFEIREQGCDHDVCRRTGVPSTAEAAARNAERDCQAAEAIRSTEP